MHTIGKLKTPILDVSGLTLSNGQRLIYTSRVMEECIREVHIFAPLNCDLLLRAETGTGKELVARLTHDLSGRRGAFIAVNCAALPEQLVEDVLFGHARGAFTGATHQTSGAFEAAHQGTLFLDEFGDLRKSDQAKILRVLQEKTITKIGQWGQEIPVDVRVIAATNADMPATVQDGSFRLDLVHRFKKDIAIPPLRQRRGDISSLVAHFLDDFAGSHRVNDTFTLSPSAWTVLMSYDYPGNVRELEKIIFIAAAYVFASSSRVITDELLENIIGAERWKRPSGSLAQTQVQIRETAPQIKARHRQEWIALLTQTLKDCKGDMHAAAKKLKMNYHAFFRNVKRHQLKT
ncbi:MAG TPA: sigma 54-interacting transcriptional regulator [Blastocatellia bacterium]|nr:sigma 54-interacting transcriptional regulator [Blastocatellia bacterium]